jgi:hypothetical protein
MTILPKKFDTHLGSKKRSPRWGVFLKDGRQGYDGPNVLCWKRKKEAQQWIDIVTENPNAMSSQVNWKIPEPASKWISQAGHPFH